MGPAKKTKVKPASAGSDRISSLSQEIKGKILSYLNTDEAVRASVLSRAWRNVWTIVPDIFLCDCSFGSLCDCNIGSSHASLNTGSSDGRPKFITLVDMVLSLHKGPLDAFTIHGKQSYHDAFARWIHMLSTKEPRDIEIKLTSGPQYMIPSSLFSISHLNFLCLRNCCIRLPPKFEGFKLLNILKLKVFSSTDSDICNLISSCPKLDVVRLKYFEGIKSLKIQAQALQMLEVEGNFEDLHVDAPNLVHAYLTLDKTDAHQFVPVEDDKKGYLKQAVGSLTCIKSLAVSGSFLTYLSKGCILTKLPGVFDHLEKISIERCLWNWTEVVAACSLFHNAPILSELDIWSYPHPEAFTRKRIWEQDQTEIQAPTLDHLETITLNDFMCLDCEIALVGLLLSWAPALEELKILVPEGTTDQSICKATKKLLALPRVSAKAKIIFT